MSAIRKDSPTSSDVHVSVPLGSDAPRKKIPIASRMASLLKRRFGLAKADLDPPPPVDNLEATILKAAFAEEEDDEEEIEKASGDPQPGERRIATVAIRHGDHLLMGKRRDNGKWTVPGGHVDPDETFDEGAQREVEEESGLEFEPEQFEALGDHETKTAHGAGDTIHVQPYAVNLDEKPKTSMKADPDGEVHRWHWVDVSEGLPSHIEKDLHVPLEHNVLMKRIGLAPDDPDNYQSDDSSQDEPADIHALGELAAGIDWETIHEDPADEDEARSDALENLSGDPLHYRKKWAEKDAHPDGDGPFDAEGLNLDLGSGHAREPGFLGVDTYPFDHGTLVHDLTLGLPFADQCATTVRMVNALHDVTDDPKPLLSEIQRILMPGGQFIYEGPNEILNAPKWLELTSHTQGIAKTGGMGAWHKQAFTRVVDADPATADDSEPRIGIAQYDMLPADALLAMGAVDYYWSDATSSGAGNRAHGYASQGALIGKGGPGSGPHPGGGRTDAEHEKAKRAADRKVERAGASHDRTPTAASHAKLQQALHERAAAHEAHASDLRARVAEHTPPTHGEIKALQDRHAEITARQNELKAKSDASKDRMAQLKAQLARSKATKSSVQKSALGTRQVRIAKVSSKLQVVYCVVLSPEESDEQEDFMTAEDVQRACHYYLMNGRVVGSNHLKPINALPVECYCAPCDFELDGGPYGPQKVKKGAWVVGIKIFDKSEWVKVENGTYQGVSVGGFGVRDPMATAAPIQKDDDESMEIETPIPMG